jgi:hypothetical protein
MRAVILQHEAHEDLGLFGPALSAEGFSFTKRFRGVEHHDLDAELVVHAAATELATAAAPAPAPVANAAITPAPCQALSPKLATTRAAHEAHHRANS